MSNNSKKSPKMVDVKQTNLFPIMTYPKLYSHRNLSVTSQLLQSQSFSHTNKFFRDICDISDSGINSMRTVSTAMSGIIWAIGGFLPYGTAIAAVGGIINVVLPVLWNESTVTEQEKIMCEVGNLIDEKIDQYAFNAATAALEGLQRVCSIYNDLVLALKDSQRKKTYHKAAEDIRIMFWNVHSSFSEAIPSFRVPDFEAVLLPTYAAAATTHLIVLQDVIKFGKIYGFEEKIIEDLYRTFTKLIEEYTNHCVKTYDKGLEKAKRKKANLEGNPYVGTAEYYKYQEIANWNLFNTYRRNMTLLVLDPVTTWPTLDPKIYPHTTKFMLSRKLYTDIIGVNNYNPSSSSTINEIEASYVRKPNLFTWLDQIQIYNKEFIDNKFLSGINLTYLYTGDRLEQEALLGYANSQICSIDVSNFSIEQAKISMRTSWYGPNIYNIEFLNAQKSNTCQISSTTQGTPPIIFAAPTSNIPDSVIKNPLKDVPNHKLSWICGHNIQDNTIIDYIGFEWMHPSLDFDNTVSKRKITQVPAIMAYTRERNANVIKGPGSTGGDLVELSTGGTIKINVLLPKAIQNYRLRIRCANQQKGSLIIFSDNKQIDFSISENPAYTPDLAYRSFRLVEIPYDFYLESSPDSEMHHTLYIQSIDGKVIIDKIEFIPQLIVAPFDTTGLIDAIARLYKLINWIDGKPDYEKGISFSVPDTVMDFEDFQTLRYQLEIKGLFGKISLAHSVEYNKKEKLYYVYIDFTDLTPDGDELYISLYPVNLYVVDPEKNNVKSKLQIASRA